MPNTVKYVFSSTLGSLVILLVLLLYWKYYYTCQNKYHMRMVTYSSKDISHGLETRAESIGRNTVTTNTPFPVRLGNINQLLITPDKMPTSLLSRLDKSTKDKFLLKLGKIQKKGTRNTNGTTGRGSLVDGYELLRSMGYSSRLPDVINIGVKKGGTTALMFYLKYHPHIQTSLEAREVHYFDWHYSNSIRWYESRMKIAHDGQLVYEKTPRYFVHDAVAKRIHRDLGGDRLRFLLCVRDPVSRLVSDFHFSKQIRAPKGWKKQQTVRSESERFIRTVLENDGSVKTDNEFVIASSYATHLRRWFKYFRRDQFLVIDNFEMVSNTLETLRKIESFLGLEHFFQEAMIFKSKNNQTCLRIDSKRRCPRDISSSILPRPNLSAELEKKLRDYYRLQNKELETLVGRAFEWAEL